MRKIALRGLLARKLRLALTALAVVLGVDAHRRHLRLHRHDQRVVRHIFTASNKGTDVAVTPHKAVDTSDNGGTPPTVPAAVLDKVRAQPGVAVRRGRGLRRRHGPGQRTASSSARAARRTSSPRSPTAALRRPSRSRTGRRPQNADEVAIDAAPPTRTASRSATRSARRGTPRASSYTLVGIATIGGVELASAAASVARLTLPEAQRMTGQDRLRRDRGRRPSRASRREELQDRSSSASSAAHRRRAHRQGAGRQAGQGHPRQPRLPADRAARVRRRRAARRRLPDLQHVLDHRRPAHARVRAAAHARRLAPAGAALGGRRGPGAGPRRRRRRLAARHRRRARCCARCSARRRRPAQQRASSSSRAR